MTETEIRNLIDGYIIDNQAYSITPAKMRDMMQKTVDYILSGAGGGGGTTPNLAEVTAEGATTGEPITIGSLTDGFSINPNEIAKIISGNSRIALSGYAGVGALAFTDPDNVHRTYIKAALSISGVDCVLTLPNISGDLMRKQDLSLSLVLSTSNTVNSILDMNFGTSPASGITKYNNLGVSSKSSGIEKMFVGLSGSIGKLFLRGAGSYGTNIVAGYPLAENTLTLPITTDTLAVRGDQGVRYRLTVTSTGASSYTFTIPTLPFSPLVMVATAGGSYPSHLWSLPLSTTSVQVGFSGAAPAAGVPLIFHVVIYG